MINVLRERLKLWVMDSKLNRKMRQLTEKKKKRQGK